MQFRTLVPVVPAAIVAAVVSGCTTTAQAPQSAPVGSQDLAFLTAAYQLIHFDLSACTIVQKSAIPPYAAPIVSKVCSDAERYKGDLERVAAQAGATLPDTLDYDHSAEVAALNYYTSYHQQPYVAQYPSPIVPKASFGGDYPSLIVAFLNYEIASHETALTDFENEAQYGQNPAVKARALATAPLVKSNLAGLQEALAASPSS